MDTAMVVDLGRQALWVTMMVSAPLLLVGLGVGLLIALGLTLSAAGGWMINTMVDYTRVLYGRIPTLFG